MCVSAVRERIENVHWLRADVCVGNQAYLCLLHI